MVAPTAVPPDPNAKPASSAADDARAAASALLEAWKTAQNEGDAEAYFALYEPKEFKGLKRTHRGKVASFDFPAWRKDRGAMFQNAFEVAVEDPQIETWLDEKDTLKPGVTKVRFVQRWRSKTYADHGPKSLLLWRDPRDGKTRIVFEELLLSRAGWEDAPRGEPSLPAVAAAATVEEMTAALEGAGLKASNASDVAFELEDPHARGLALRAVADMGSFDCVPEIMVGYSCGEEGADWGKAEETTIESPCMRRALVLPLLQGAALPRDALLAAAEPLQAIVAAKESEERRDPDFVAAVLHAIDPLPEADRVPFLAAALSPQHWDELAAPRLAQLSAESLYRLWEESSNPAALRPLPVAAHAARLAEIQSKTSLPDDLILPVVPVLAAGHQRDLLARLSEDASCKLAMTAADALAKLGDSSRLPTWKAANTPEAGMQVICRLQHDPDRARALAELAHFFHPTRKARDASMRQVVTEFISYDEEGNVDEPEPPSAEEQRVIDEVSRLLGEGGSGAITASLATLDAPAPEALLRTTVFEGRDERAYGHSYESLELFEENGHVYVDHFGSYEYQWNGCPC